MPDKGPGARPVGTDGSDYAFRMTIDSRFQRAAKSRVLVGKYLRAQGSLLLVRALWLLFLWPPYAPAAAVACCAIGAGAVGAGTLGLRRSSSLLLRSYMVATVVALVLSLLPLTSAELYTQTGDHRSVLFRVLEGAQVLGVFSVQIGAMVATSSLLRHQKKA